MRLFSKSQKCSTIVKKLRLTPLVFGQIWDFFQRQRTFFNELVECPEWESAHDIIEQWWSNKVVHGFWKHFDRASMFTIFSMHVSTCYNKLVQQWRMNICCNSIVIIAEQHSWRPAQPLWSFLPAQRCSSLLACVQASARRLCCGVFSHIYIEITS